MQYYRKDCKFKKHVILLYKNVILQGFMQL